MNRGIIASPDYISRQQVTKLNRTSRSSHAIARVNNERNILAMCEYYFR